MIIFQDILNDSLQNERSELEAAVGKQVAKTMVNQTHKRSTYKGRNLRQQTLPPKDTSTRND